MDHPTQSTTSRWRVASLQTRCHRLARALAVALLVGLTIVVPSCGGDGAETATVPSSEPAGTDDQPVLTLTGAGTTRELTLADLKALPALDTWAGVKTQYGMVLGPDPYTGVGLADLVAVVAEVDAGVTVVVTARDGSSVEFTSENLAGAGFVTYDPETGDEVETTQVLTPMLAYSSRGEPLDPAEHGRLAVQVSQPEAGQVVDARWAASDVVAIDVVTP